MSEVGHCLLGCLGPGSVARAEPVWFRWEAILVCEALLESMVTLDECPCESHIPVSLVLRGKAIACISLGPMHLVLPTLSQILPK